jgi:hypothetical protein
VHLAMQYNEGQLFKSFLRCATHYVEFGCGGSTCMAASLVSGSVTSVDSSDEWLEKASQQCRSSGSLVQPDMIYVDIGPVGDWGYPIDPNTRDGVVQKLPFSGYTGARKQLACEALAEIEGCPVVRRPASPVQARRG